MNASLKEQIEKEEAYNKYIGYFTDEKGLMIKDPENIYKTLYEILSKNLEHTKQDLGGYHFEKFILLLNDSLDEIEAEIKDYANLFYPTDHIHYGYYFYFKPKLEKALSELIGKPQPTEAVKPDESKKEFKDFFIKGVHIDVIQKIQSEFKDCKGKKLAFLIYLLHKVHKLIDYSSNSNTEARKHFIIGLTQRANIVAGVDKVFNLNDVTIKDPQFENDNDYITIKEKLCSTIK